MSKEALKLQDSELISNSVILENALLMPDEDSEMLNPGSWPDSSRDLCVVANELLAKIQKIYLSQLKVKGMIQTSVYSIFRIFCELGCHWQTFQRIQKICRCDFRTSKSIF